MSRRDPKQILTICVVVLIGLFICGFTLYQARNLIEGPKVTITSPITGSSFNDPFITLTGTASNIASLTLNDQPIYMDEQGHFSQKLLLVSGYNVVTVTAKDKFGHTVEKHLELVLNSASG